MPTKTKTPRPTPGADPFADAPQPEYIALGRIRTNPDNPRTITKEKFAKLVNSILIAPWMLPIRALVVDETLTILGGNMRHNAIGEIAGMDHASIRARLESLDEFRSMPEGDRAAILRFWERWLESPTEPILRAERLTEAQKRRFIITDNASFGDWDMDALANGWDPALLSDWGLDLDWDSLRGGGDGDSAEEDEFDPDTETNAHDVQPGDVWILGDHRVMCGDSTNADAMAILMDGMKADMVFTDPPYGVAIGDKNKTLNTVQKAGRCTENIENDTIPTDELYDVLVAAMTNCREACRDSASYFVTSPQGGEMCLMMNMMKAAGLPVRHVLIWEKNSATFSVGRLDYDYQHEPILYTWTKSHHNFRGGEFRTSIWKIDKPRKCDLHPTMKPVALVANCIRDCSRSGEIILDVFGGSGTTIIAAEQLGRRAFVMEIDPHYVDVTISRWEKETGLAAYRADEGGWNLFSRNAGV